MWKGLFILFMPFQRSQNQKGIAKLLKEFEKFFCIGRRRIMSVFPDVTGVNRRIIDKVALH